VVPRGGIPLRAGARQREILEAQRPQVPL